MSGLSLLERLGLHAKPLRAWAMYDWANSAFVLVIITAIFPTYYKQVLSAGVDQEVANAWYGWATSIALIIVALVSPPLGALADFRGMRKRFLGTCVLLGVTSTALMFFLTEGAWVPALVLFAVGNIAVTGSFLFYDSLLPHIAAREEVDRVSAGGYALGYLGSGLLLVLNIAWILSPDTFGIPDAGVATRLAFLSVAIWWGGFSLPLFRHVPEPPATLPHSADGNINAALLALKRIPGTLRELRREYRDAFMMLLGMMVYNEGIGTIIRMAAIYALTIGLPQTDVILAILLVQFVGIPFSFLFGNLADRLGTKRSILLGLTVYAVAGIVAYGMETAAEFYLLALLIASVQGGTQALSRSLFASMIPKHRATEFFGFFSVFEKFSGIFGPALFAMMIWLTGSSREAVLSVIGLFVAGGVLLSFCNVERGRRMATSTLSAAG